MSGFFRKLERFVLNLLIITLIILISVQFLMKNETAHQRLQDLEMTIKNFLGQEKQETVQVVYYEDRNAGYITIDLLQDLSLPGVWVTRNGEKVANFSEGITMVTVREGDLIGLDARSYTQPLWFEITSLSPSIRSWQPGQQFRVRGELVKLGQVALNGQL